jgi:hypothetical protein
MASRRRWKRPAIPAVDWRNPAEVGLGASWVERQLGGSLPLDDDARKYEEAYNKADAKTLAGFYSDDVDYID